MMRRPAVSTLRSPSPRSVVSRRSLSSGAPGAAPPSAPRRAWVAYTRALDKHPLPVKISSAITIFSGGDLVVQCVEARSFSAPNDWLRTARMAAFGVVATCFMHGWWGFLEPRAAAIFCPVEQKLANTVFKVAADQSFGAGCFNAIFFGQSALLEGRTPPEAARRVSEQWWPQMQVHWCFWPAFHLCNFHFNSLHLRIFYQNIGSIGWSCVLSDTARRAAADVGEPPPAEVVAVL